jgi:Zn-dependent M28 family amino/carboxypeptidase
MKQRPVAFDAERAFRHVANLVAIGPRPSGSAGIARAQGYIEQTLRSFGVPFKEDVFTAETPVGSVAMMNIVAKIPGESPEIVLLATHYDTKRLPDFVGANDGGSSTGLMLELARVLALPATGRAASKPKFTVWIVFFDGEEAIVEYGPNDGFQGSRHLATEMQASGELKKVRAMILADLIGDADLDIRRESNSSRALVNLIWRTARELGYQKHFLSESVSILDDHMAFVQRGVQAVDLIDMNYGPGNSYWHTSQDILEKLSPKSLAVVGQVILATLDKLTP